MEDRASLLKEIEILQQMVQGRDEYIALQRELVETHERHIKALETEVTRLKGFFDQVRRIVEGRATA